MTEHITDSTDPIGPTRKEVVYIEEDAVVIINGQPQIMQTIVNGQPQPLKIAYYLFECPHCDCYTQVGANEVNCQIFRHAVYKNSGQQINPHTPKEICDKLIEEDAVHGCCKPFRLFRGVDGKVEYVNACDYI